jgi:predicted esterase
MSALTPFDNDVHASNVADIPILVRHGTDDDNVPIYHSRVLTAIVNAWARNQSMIEYDLYQNYGTKMPLIPQSGSRKSKDRAINFPAFSMLPESKTS